jgi:hypothetical protein
MLVITGWNDTGWAASQWAEQGEDERSHGVAAAL